MTMAAGWRQPAPWKASPGPCLPMGRCLPPARRPTRWRPLMQEPVPAQPPGVGSRAVGLVAVGPTALARSPPRIQWFRLIARARPPGAVGQIPSVRQPHRGDASAHHLRHGARRRLPRVRRLIPLTKRQPTEPPPSRPRRQPWGCPQPAEPVCPSGRVWAGCRTARERGRHPAPAARSRPAGVDGPGSAPRGPPPRLPADACGPPGPHGRPPTRRMPKPRAQPARKSATGGWTKRTMKTSRA
jgi:hypothetical protein